MLNAYMLTRKNMRNNCIKQKKKKGISMGCGAIWWPTRGGVHNGNIIICSMIVHITVLRTYYIYRT